MRPAWCLLVLTTLAAGCGLLLDADSRPDSPNGDGGGIRDADVRDSDADAGLDADAADTGPDAGCVWGPWENVQRIPEVSSTSDDWSPAPSAGNLVLFFDSWRNGFENRNDLFTATRASLADPWGMPTALEELNTSDIDGAPAALPDGLTLYFGSNRPGSEAVDIWKATRPTIESPFDAPQRVPGVNSRLDETSPHVTPDGLRLYFSSSREGDSNIFVAARARPTDSFSTATRLAVISEVGSRDSSPSLSADETEIYFSSDRAGGRGQRDLWYATRADRMAEFGAPINLGTAFNGEDDDTHPALSVDGRTLYFVRDACVDGLCGFEGDLWKAERGCVP